MGFGKGERKKTNSEGSDDGVKDTLENEKERGDQRRKEDDEGG